MSLKRIRAVLLQEFYITKHSLEVIIDTFFFSAIAIIVFSFMAIFISKTAGQLAAQEVLIGVLLWEVIRITQYSLSVGSLWNIWSRNLSNMFIAPLSLSEYMSAGILSGIAKALVNFATIAVIARLIFQFNIFQLGTGNLILYFINLSIFAWSTGFAIVGIILRYGTRIQALAWGAVFLFQPLTAAFFPVSTLPRFFQGVAYLFPATYIFEAARSNLAGMPTNWPYLIWAFTENVIYFILAIWFLNFMFKRSKQTGQFARNEQ